MPSMCPSSDTPSGSSWRAGASGAVAVQAAGRCAQAPVLEAQGFHLMGGRLLPGETGQARAQFMCTRIRQASASPAVSRCSIPRRQPASAPASFQWSSDGGASHGFYWIEGRQGYALSASLPRERLQALANAVYQQLNWKAAGLRSEAGLSYCRLPLPPSPLAGSGGAGEQDANALFDRLHGLPGTGLTANGAFLGFAVVNAARLFGKFCRHPRCFERPCATTASMLPAWTEDARAPRR